VADRLAAAGRMTHVDGVPEIEMLHHGRGIGGIVVHVMTVAHLRRTAVATPVMSDDAVALADEIQELRIPIVGAERPAVVEDDRLRALRAPVLVIDSRTVIARDRAHWPTHPA